MNSATWHNYLIVVGIIIIGVILCIRLITDYDYPFYQPNNIPTGSTVRIKSAVAPETLNNRTNIYMTVPQCQADPNSNTYPYGCLTTFLGAPTETFTVSDQFLLSTMSPSKIDMTSSVNAGLGNRYVMTPIGSNPNAIPLINTTNSSFGGPTAYQYYGLRQYSSEIGEELTGTAIGGSAFVGIWAPFLLPRTNSAGIQAAGIGSTPVYNMIYNNVGCLTGNEDNCYGSFPGDSLDNGKMRVRYAPPTINDPVCRSDIPGLRQYSINEDETNTSLEYVFYVERV